MIERKTPFVPLLGVFLNKPLPPLPSEHAATSADIATLKKIDQNLEQLPGLAFSLEALEALAQELTTTTVPPAVGREFASATYKIKLSENNKLLLQPTGNNVYVTLNQNSLSSSSPRTRTSNEKRVKFVEKQPLQSSRELNVKTISITGTEEIKCVANPESLSPTNATSSNSLAPLHKVPSPCSSRTTLENIEGPNMLSTFKAHHKQSSINDDVLSIRSQNSSMDNLHEPKHDSIIHRLFFYASHSSDEETDSEKRRHKSFRSKKPFTADEKTEGGFLSRIFHLDDNKSKISPSTSGSISKTTDSSSVDSLNKVQVRIETSGSSRDSQVEQQHHENVVTRFIRNYSAKDQHLNSDKETKIPNSPNDPGRSPVLVASSPPISPNLSPITLTSPQSLGYEEQEDFASGHHRHDSFLYRLFHPYHDEGHVRPQERPISPESSSEGRVSSPTSNESLERNTSSALFRRKRAATSPVGSTSPTQAISPSVSHDRLKHSHSTETLSEKYGHPQEKLGQGAQAEVRLAHVKTTIDGLTQEKLYAIKTFKKRGDHGNIKEYTKKVIAEFCINNSLRNENIVTAVDLIKDERGHWCEVLEYMPGGDLYSRIRDSSLTDVDEINCFFKQLVNAVTFMHTMGVAHRYAFFCCALLSLCDFF